MTSLQSQTPLDRNQMTPLSLAQAILPVSFQMNLKICMLFLLISALQTVISGDDDVVLTGTVGGDVTFNCSSSYSQSIQNIYFQKDDPNVAFVNGIHSRIIEQDIAEEYKNRSTINSDDSSLNLWDLRASDEGKYSCIIFHKNPIIDGEKKYTYFQLTVTANYSVPTVTAQQCSDGGDGPVSCVVGCSSSGGYPKGSLSWRVLNGNTTVQQMGGIVSLADRHSGAWNISQIITINCTHPTNITCSVGSAISPPLGICKSSAPPDHTVQVIIACVVLFMFFILVLLLIMNKVCRRQRPSERRVQVPLKLADQIHTETEL